jgi:predicted nucleotidyltransferase
MMTTMEALRRVLEGEPRLAYAIVFGSAARGTAHPHSDVDVAVGLTAGARLSPRDVGTLVADLERAAGRPIDLVLLDEAPAPLAFRIFRDGVTLVERDHRALADRKARAILEYLDFRPLEALLARGALASASRGR